jgi:hypothetical protein
VRSGPQCDPADLPKSTPPGSWLGGAVDRARVTSPPQPAKHYKHCGPWPRERHSAATASLPSVWFTQLPASPRCLLARETAFSLDLSTRASETTGFPQSELTLHALRARSALPAHRETQRTVDRVAEAGSHVPPTVNEGTQRACTKKPRRQPSMTKASMSSKPPNAAIDRPSTAARSAAVEGPCRMACWASSVFPPSGFRL